jgi:hypothetical protein
MTLPPRSNSKMFFLSLTLLVSALLSIASAADSPFLWPNKAAPCASFAQNSHNLAGYNTTFVNAALYAAGSRKVARTLNTYAFCEVNATVSYAENNSLHFTLWLPEVSQYRGSFTAVGACL